MLTTTHWCGIAASLLVMVGIVLLGPYSTPEMFLPDQGALWYYWKLAEPDTWTRLSAWLLYALHQAGLWYLVAWARSRRPAYRSGLHPVNIIALAFNGLFVIAHIVQTRLFYDGLAQDTSVLSSQFSVIFMLVFVIIMENRRRGMLFGHKLPFAEPAGGFLRRYHGYYFSWAIVYTFWFHPIEDNLGHLLGTFYILLLLFQGSLFFTSFHRNRVWTVLLETFVLLHGAMVAWLNFEGGHWQMFLFGFLTLFIVTQMHGIGLGLRSKLAFVGVYFLLLIGTYLGRGWDFLEVLRIPAAELGLAVLFAAAGWLAWRLQKKSAIN